MIPRSALLKGRPQPDPPTLRARMGAGLCAGGKPRGVPPLPRGARPRAGRAAAGAAVRRARGAGEGGGACVMTAAALRSV